MKKFDEDEQFETVWNGTMDKEGITFSLIGERDIRVTPPWPTIPNKRAYNKTGLHADRSKIKADGCNCWPWDGVHADDCTIHIVNANKKIEDEQRDTEQVDREVPEAD